jgi:hypothetical protein
MSHLVRKNSSSLIQRTIEALPPRSHRIDGISVASQLSLGVEPRLSLAWRVDPPRWNAGYTLLVFESTTSFSAERYPQDLHRHGSLIIETLEDSCFEYVPTEGIHYFTFVIHKKILLGLSERMAVLRFSEIVPSAKVAVGRIRDQIELQEMLQRHETGAIEHEARLNEALVQRIRSQRSLDEIQNPPTPKAPPPATDPVLAEELHGIDAMVNAVAAQEAKVAELKKDARFQGMSGKKRREILNRVAERLDPGEISARQEMKGG